MTPNPQPHVVSTPEQLAALFGDVGEASLKKELPYIHPHYRTLIEASPFAVLATNGPDELDASPRGDPPGFVVVEDEQTLLLPERRGNNRVDRACGTCSPIRGWRSFFSSPAWVKHCA